VGRSGWALDRAGSRLILAFGALAMAAGLMALSRAGDLATTQNIYLVIGTYGFACLYAPLITTVGLWFDRCRGLALGIVTAGGTVGQGITPLVVQPIIAAYGWRNACLLLGVGHLLVLVPTMIVLTKPPDPGAERTSHRGGLRAGGSGHPSASHGSDSRPCSVASVWRSRSSI
jgi:nitrate/nitrite transporter NarK